MDRFGFAVTCTDPLCSHRPAKYKVAAEWTGGGYTELKTYGFADDDCLERVVAAAKERMARLSLAEGEHIGEIHVYLLESNRHDYELRRVDMPAAVAPVEENPSRAFTATAATADT